MSDVEKFYKAICDKLQTGVPWNELHPHHQAIFIQALNMILQVVYSGGK